MKKALLILSSIILLSACNTDENQVVKTFEDCVAAGNLVAEIDPERCTHNGATFINVDSFEDCVVAGNPVMESYPRQCRHADVSYVEDVQVPIPTDECPRDFQPVCGQMQMDCVNEPCNPVEITFENRCLAENEGAQNIKEGSCEDEEVNAEGACLSFDGVWLPEFNECEGMAPQQCLNLGGTPNECASPCRNDPDTQACILSCVLICQF